MEFSASIKRIAVAAAFAVLSVFAVQAARADTITFDDLDGSGPDGSAIVGNYGGYNWSNFYAIDGAASHPGTGYATGTVSGLNTAYNGFGQPAEITGADPFKFGGGYFTAAYLDISVHIVGFIDALQVYDYFLPIDTLGPTLIDLDWTGINRLRFESVGASQFVADNLRISAVPIPAALPLFGSAILLGGLLLRRRKVAKSKAD